jgi:peptidoglycan/xylan/chitin deacetylase (PgdA/CDA1 family)
VVAAIAALLTALVVGSSSGGGHRARPIHEVGYFARLAQLVGRGTGSLATDEQADENAAIDRTLSYTPYVRVAGSQHRELALTFDDGPGPYTPAILSVLERKHAEATFFEVGVLLTYFHASTARIVRDGFPIGDHTESHAAMAPLSFKAQARQLLEETSAVGNYGAPFARLFRPPYGSWNRSTLRLLRRYHMLMVLWTVDTSDWRHQGVGGIVDAAVNGARPGAIVLLHDAGGNRAETVAALPRIIDRLRALGYKLVTVPRLLLDNPAPADQQAFVPTGEAG